jgi:hypothetical protein
MQGARVYDTDSGAGTEYTLGAVIRVAASGGSVAITGDAANGLDVDVTRVSGNVAVTIADGVDVATGAVADAIVAAGAAGSISAKLRRVTQGLEDLKTSIVLAAGTNGIGKLTANSGVDIGDVDVTSVIPGTGATNLGKAEDAAHTSGDTGVMALAVRTNTLAASSGTDGDYETIKTDTNGAVWTHPTDTIAHDAGDAGNGLKIAAKAETSPKGITTVADGDRTDLYADADGMLMVKLNTSYADIVSERVSNTDGASTAFTNFSAVASTKNYVTAISVHNASGTNGYIDFRDGTGGSVLWTMALPANGGAVLSSATPLFHTSANTALAFDVSAALTTVYISVSGFQSKL